MTAYSSTGDVVEVKRNYYVTQNMINISCLKTGQTASYKNALKHLSV